MLTSCIHHIEKENSVEYGGGRRSCKLPEDTIQTLVNTFPKVERVTFSYFV